MAARVTVGLFAQFSSYKTTAWDDSFIFKDPSQNMAGVPGAQYLGLLFGGGVQ